MRDREGGVRQDAASPRRGGEFRHRARSMVRGLFAGALAFGTLVALAPAPAQAAGSSSTPAFTSLGQCLAQHKRLLLAFVLDESGSLGDASRHQPGSDPTAQRVTAAQVAVQGLTQLASRGVGVDVFLSGFSDDLHSYGGWQTLDSASSPSIVSQLEGFRSRDRGLDTDFYTALAGVNQAIATKAAALKDAPCEVVLLFTDGRFDVATQVAKPYDANAKDPAATKVAKGVTALCAADGPMQSIRRSNGVTITLALADASAGANQPDRGFLSRLATGDCYSPGAQHGASFDAANASDLVAQFDAVISGIRGGTQRLGDCAGTAHSFDVVQAVGSFHVLANLGTSPGDVVVTTPDRRQVRVTPAGVVSTAPTGLDVHASVTSERFVAVDVSPKGAATGSSGWSGRWTVNFAKANAGGTCQVFLFEAWKPVLRATSLKPGSAQKLVVDIVGADGKAVALGALKSDHRLTGSLTADGAKSATDLAFVQVGDHYEAKYTLAKSYRGKSVKLQFVFHVVVAGADIASAPSSTDVPVGVNGVAVGPRPGGNAKTTPAGVRRTDVSSSGETGLSTSTLVLKGLLLLLALGLLAFLVMKVMRRRQSTFVDPSRLQTARVPVRVRRTGMPTRVAANGEESPLALRPGDFAACKVRAGGLRSFSLNQLTFEASPRGRLFSRGQGEVGLPKQFVTASGGTTLGDGFTKGLVPLDLRGTWVYELEAFDEGDDEHESFVDGYVTVFIAGSARGNAEAKKLVDSFNSFLSEIVLRLAKHAPSRASEPTAR